MPTYPRLHQDGPSAPGREDNGPAPIPITRYRTGRDEPIRSDGTRAAPGRDAAREAERVIEKMQRGLDELRELADHGPIPFVPGDDDDDGPRAA